MPVNEIEELKNQFVKQLSPIKIYLFGSFANGTNTENSDFDFYIVVDDKVTDLIGMTANAYKAIRSTKQRPVDIIVGTSRCWCYIDQNRNRSDKESEVFP